MTKRQHTGMIPIIVCAKAHCDTAAMAISFHLSKTHFCPNLFLTAHRGKATQAHNASHDGTQKMPHDSQGFQGFCEPDGAGADRNNEHHDPNSSSDPAIHLYILKVRSRAGTV